MNISINYDLACSFGFEKAILLQNFAFWTKVNKKNKTNFREGKYWTKWSVKALHKQYKFISESVIRRAIESLVKEKIIVKKQLGKRFCDRSSWYAFEDQKLLKSILTNLINSKNKEKENDKPANQSNQNDTPICQNDKSIIDNSLINFVSIDDITEIRKLYINNNINLTVNQIKKIFNIIYEYNLISSSDNKIIPKEYFQNKLKQSLFMKEHHYYKISKYSCIEKYLYCTLRDIDWWEKTYITNSENETKDNQEITKKQKELEKKQEELKEIITTECKTEYETLSDFEKAQIDSEIQEELKNISFIKNNRLNSDLINIRLEQERVRKVLDRVTLRLSQDNDFKYKDMLFEVLKQF